MNRRHRPAFLQVVRLGCLGFAAVLVARAAVPAAPRPNIVFILSDDQGFADIGYHGSEIATPHLDRLAASGVKLESFYVQPVCTPTRAALMTGLYPMRLGLQLGVIKPESQHGLPLTARTLPQALREAGYFTAITGKWHLGNGGPAYLPTARGFNHQHGFYLGSTDYFTHERDGGLDWHRQDRALRQEGYTTDLIAAEAVQIIEAHGGQRPIFLYVAFNAPHTPLQATEPYLARYAKLPEKRRAYAAMVTQMDDAVGRVVAALDRKRLRENTLIVFSSDNGGNLPAASNSPLRDQKGSVYEGGVRVPAFATWPGRLPAGTTVTQPLHMTDWHATLLRLAGAKAAAGVTLDGRDLWPALNGDPRAIHDEILINAAPGTGALRRGDWKLIVNGHLRFKGGTPDAKFSWADLLRESKLPVEDAKRQQVELFNLADDPAESRNLAAEKPELLRELMARYESYARQAAPLVGGDKPGDFKVPAVWGETR
ncbi:MAG: arylsulfatase [Opitutaceae bacterium]|nr:arylsulfatase [Opitutaceae bacterium]